MNVAYLLHPFRRTSTAHVIQKFTSNSVSKLNKTQGIQSRRAHLSQEYSGFADHLKGFRHLPESRHSPFRRPMAAGEGQMIV
jgi:curved DNA-binding protein CbpA